MMKRIFLFFAYCTSVLCSWAYDFMVDGIYYDIISETDLTVRVTYEKCTYYNKNEDYNGYYVYTSGYSGMVVVPSAVNYKNNRYNVVSIGRYAFADTHASSSISSIILPEGVTSIGDHAFYGCSNLTSITIPESVTSIGRSAFYKCSSLTSITLPESLASIEYETFYLCSRLTSINIPEGVTSIGSYAFDRCSTLTSINIPESVTRIGDYAFDRCSSLTIIGCFSVTPPSIASSGTFSGVPETCEIYIPYGSLSSYKAASYWKEFTNYVEFNNPSQPSHQSTILAIWGTPVRWESSRDGGLTWKNIDCTSTMYTESDPERGEVMYRILNADGTYSDILTITYYDVVPEEIVTSPVGATKTVDESTTFTLDVKDDGYTYQWMHNGTAIAGATASSYTIPVVKSSDAGSYYCVVSNPVSTVNSVPVELTVNKCAQVIGFPELEAKVYGDADFSLPAQTDKGLAISYQSSNTSVATVTGNVVSIKGVGETNIIASQAGNDDYLEAAYVTRKLTVNKITQTITFATPATKTYEDMPFTLPVATDKGLTISYKSVNTDVATISGNVVTIVGAGSTEIVASQAGDSYHYAATPVTRTLTVNRKSQTITFGALGTVTYGDAPIELNKYTDKNLTITYTSDNASVATVNSNKVSILKPGVATITATQSGTKNYLPAQSISRTLTVNKAPQTIELYEIAAKNYGDADFALPAKTDKGLSISYVSDNTNVAVVNGNVVSIKGVGEANITATQAGNEYYKAAVLVTLPLTVSKSYQTIVFDALPVVTYGASPITLKAKTDASTTVTYESSDESVATVTGTTLTIVGAGTCYITAKADGDKNYYGATPVQRELKVNKASQTISFAAVENKTYGDAPFALSAASNRNLEVSISSSSASIVSVSGKTATIRGAGTVTLTAKQEGTKNYESATAQIKIVVNKAALMAEAVDAERVYGDANPKLKISYNGFKNGDTAEDLDNMPEAVCAATQKSNVGEYDITIGAVTDKNYTLTYRNGILTVKKAPLTIIAEDATKIYGEKNPTLAVRYEGFKNKQTEAELLNKPTVSTTAKTMSNVGRYPIVAEGAEARNYELTYREGTLVVNKAALTVKLDDVKREYGTDSKYTYSFSGFKGSDDTDVLDAWPNVVTAADVKSNVGVYEMALSGGYDNNYEYHFTYNSSKAYVTVTKAPLLITADDKTMEYLGTMPRFTMSYSGFRNDDTKDDLDQWPAIKCDADASSLVGMYVIELTGGYDDNYEYTLQNGVLTIMDGSSVESAEKDGWPADIYDMNGRMIRKNAYSLYGLEKGLYIVNGKKVMVK